MNNDEFEHGGGKDPWDGGSEGRPEEDKPGEPSGQESGAPQPEESGAPQPEESGASQPEENGAPQPEEGGTSQPEENGSGEETPDGDGGAPREPGDQPPRQEDRPPYGPWNGNPYDRYGQYGTYGQDGRNGSPYGQYGQYGQYGNGGQNEQQGQYGNPGGYGPYRENPYDRGRQPYWDYQYGGQYQPPRPVPPRPPHRMGAGLKVFLWVIGVIAVGLVAGLTVYGVRFVQNNSASAPELQSSPWSDSSSAGETSSPAQSAIGGVTGDGTDSSFEGITIASKPAGAEMSVKNIYKKVIPSVVGVETTITNMQGSASGVGEGTGIIATSDGYILTNAHVVNYSRGNKVKVILHDNSEYQATVVGYDQTSDIAVLKIKASGLTPATFGSVDIMEVGDQVLAIGNPGGISFAGSLTVGYVSALDRAIEAHSTSGMTYIQTDAAINPGNSGGPLVNLYGQVIGINSNKIVATGYEGMGFSIPVSRASSIINDLISHGYVSGRSRLGITAGTVTDTDRELKDIPQGVVIIEVGSDSDLKNSGVVAGDIITKADGKTIAGMDDLYAVLNDHKPGDSISMTIYSTSDSEKAGGKKAGTTSNVTVKLLEDKGETQAK
jgi:serine protease Do